MDDKTQNSGNNINSETSAVTLPTTDLKSTKNKNALVKKLPLILIVIVLVAGIAGVYYQQNSKLTESNKKITDLQGQFKTLNDTNNAAKNNNADKVNKDEFQAVFLSGGQVYFGKITNITDSQITLANIYYLRVNSQTITVNNVNNASGNDISLVKLGNELHGPEDVMYIERKSDLFWENLKSDSQVSKAINDFQKQHP